MTAKQYLRTIQGMGHRQVRPFFAEILIDAYDTWVGIYLHAHTSQHMKYFTYIVMSTATVTLYVYMSPVVKSNCIACVVGWRLKRALDKAVGSWNDCYNLREDTHLLQGFGT